MIVFNLYALAVFVVGWLVSYPLGELGFAPRGPTLAVTLLLADLAIRGWVRPRAFPAALLHHDAGGTVFWVVPVWAVAAAGLASELGAQGFVQLVVVAGVLAACGATFVLRFLTPPAEEADLRPAAPARPAPAWERSPAPGPPPARPTGRPVAPRAKPSGRLIGKREP